MYINCYQVEATFVSFICFYGILGKKRFPLQFEGTYLIFTDKIGIQ